MTEIISASLIATMLPNRKLLKFAEFFTNPIPFAIVNPAVQTELKGQSNYLKSMCLSVKGNLLGGKEI